jgi:hypothetical protein
MSLVAAITASLSAQLEVFTADIIRKTLKQVAQDFDLDYKVLKNYYEIPSRSKSEDAAEVPVPVVQVTPKAPAPKAAKAPKAVVTVADDVPVVALSKMKKADLVELCEQMGLDSEGTVPVLRGRIKDARGDAPAPAPAKTAPDPEAPPPKAKATKAKATPAKKAAPPPPPPPLEEEGDDGEDDADICQEIPVEFDEEYEDEADVDEHEGETLQTRLKRMLAMGGGDEGEDE